MSPNDSKYRSVIVKSTLLKPHAGGLTAIVGGKSNVPVVSQGAPPLFSFSRISLFILSRVERGAVERVEIFADTFVARQRYYSLCAINSVVHVRRGGRSDEMLFNFTKARGKTRRRSKIPLIAEAK